MPLISKEGTETVGKNDGCYDGESINVPRRTSETHRTIYQEFQQELIQKILSDMK